MPRLRCLDRNIGSFKVANFTDHDDVGVLPQKRLQCHGKRHSGTLIHAHLINTRQSDFSGVFSRCNVDARGVENI